MLNDFSDINAPFRVWVTFPRDLISAGFWQKPYTDTRYGTTVLNNHFSLSIGCDGSSVRALLLLLPCAILPPLTGVTASFKRTRPRDTPTC